MNTIPPGAAPLPTTAVPQPDGAASWLPTPSTDVRPLLRDLWIFLMLNYLYADVMGLMDARLLTGFLKGELNGMAFTPAFFMGAAVMMEVPILMTVLSTRLSPRWSRRSNLAAGLFKGVVVAATLTVGTPTGYYLFFAVIELVATVVLLALAWRWRPASATATAG